MAQHKSSTYENLERQGYPAELPLEGRDKFACKEQGCSYRLKGIAEYDSICYAVDGVIVTDNTPRCDKLLLIKLDRDKWVRIFIELKGSNIAHALEQILCTLRNPIFKHHADEENRARVIASGRIPQNRSDLIVEKAKNKLKKDFNCSTKILRSGTEETFTPPE